MTFAHASLPLELDAHVREAVEREGDRPAFPPTRRDALILGGTVFDLLDRHAFREVIANLHYFPQTIRDHFGETLAMAA